MLINNNLKIEKELLIIDHDLAKEFTEITKNTNNYIINELDISNDLLHKVELLLEEFWCEKQMDEPETLPIKINRLIEDKHSSKASKFTLVKFNLTEQAYYYFLQKNNIENYKIQILNIFTVSDKLSNSTPSEFVHNFTTQKLIEKFKYTYQFNIKEAAYNLLVSKYKKETIETETIKVLSKEEYEEKVSKQELLELYKFYDLHRTRKENVANLQKYKEDLYQLAIEKQIIDPTIISIESFYFVDMIDICYCENLLDKFFYYKRTTCEDGTICKLIQIIVVKIEYVEGLKNYMKPIEIEDTKNEQKRLLEIKQYYEQIPKIEDLTNDSINTTNCVFDIDEIDNIKITKPILDETDCSEITLSKLIKDSDNPTNNYYQLNKEWKEILFPTKLPIKDSHISIEELFAFLDIVKDDITVAKNDLEALSSTFLYEGEKYTKSFRSIAYVLLNASYKWTLIDKLWVLFTTNSNFINELMLKYRIQFNISSIIYNKSKEILNVRMLYSHNSITMQEYHNKLKFLFTVDIDELD